MNGSLPPEWYTEDESQGCDCENESCEACTQDECEACKGCQALKKADEQEFNAEDLWE